MLKQAKRDITITSKFHDTHVSKKNVRVKILCVWDYNVAMGGVHLKNHKLQQILAGESEQQMKEVFFLRHY
jgi:hypothetical protein